MVKLLTAVNTQELETMLNEIGGVDLKQVGTIQNGNCFALVGDTTKPSLTATANGVYNQGPYGTVTVNVSG